MEKKKLITSFILPEKLNNFIEYLKTDFKIYKNDIQTYKNIEDNSNLIVIFNLTIPEQEYIDFRITFPNSVIVHKKSGVYYTINALNALVEAQNAENIGNINYGSVKIDWLPYKNKLILLKDKELTFLTIERIF